MSMPLYPTWEDLALRLLATLVAAGLIGLDREAKGHAAGLRTTTLVGLAAALVMVQANLLLPMAGKTSTGFATMDVMRLPLGVLTGVGFIGGGAILKHGGFITGITTAATLWIVTAIGLSFGGGQYALGGVGAVLAIVVLWGMSRIDVRIPRQYRASLTIATGDSGRPPDLSPLIAPLGYEARFQQSRCLPQTGAEVVFEIRWKQRESVPPALGLLDAIGVQYTVLSFEITSQASH